MLTPLGCHLDRTQTALHRKGLISSGRTEQARQLRDQQIRATVGLVQPLQTKAEAVAREQPGGGQSRDRLDRQLRRLLGVQVQGAEAPEDLLRDRVQKRLAFGAVGVYGGTPQHDAVLGAQDVHTLRIARSTNICNCCNHIDWWALRLEFFLYPTSLTVLDTARFGLTLADPLDTRQEIAPLERMEASERQAD